MRTDVWGLVPAAGRGARFGSQTSKLLVEIAGRPLLAWTLDRLLACGVSGLTVALPDEWLQGAAGRVLEDPRIGWIAGGETRQDSVAACLQASPTTAELVLVHDGARPAVAIDDVRATIAAAREAEGAVLGRPLTDTLKRVRGERVTATVDRAGFFRAETPQVFWRAILERALREAREDGFVGSDEASLVERLPGVVIKAVPSSRPNPKVTERRDLALVESLLTRVGH